MPQVSPPRHGLCVYCGEPCGPALACRACSPLLALDPVYADAHGRLDEAAYWPAETRAE